MMRISRRGKTVFRDRVFALLEANPLESGYPNLDFVGCRVGSLKDGEKRPEDYQKDLKDLFP